MILLTSFTESTKLLGDKFSIACHQPKGFHYPELLFLAPFTEDFRCIRSRHFHVGEDNLSPYENYNLQFRHYSEEMFLSYLSRWDEITNWTKSLTADNDVILCAWAPFTHATKEQLKEVGAFNCHSGLAYHVIKTLRPDLKVKLDGSREQQLVMSYWDDLNYPHQEAL